MSWLTTDQLWLLMHTQEKEEEAEEEV